jgi:hypothetical protein
VSAYTLPGDLPGFWRVGSRGRVTVVRDGRPVPRDVTIVEVQDDGRLTILIDGSPLVGSRSPAMVDALLTDPTSRIHALWWLFAPEPLTVLAATLAARLGVRPRWGPVADAVMDGLDLPPDDLDVFCRVLRAAAAEVHDA